jgi:hypothetical protein
VGDTHGFADVDHTVELTGTCAACANRASSRAPRRAGDRFEADRRPAASTTANGSA